MPKMMSLALPHGVIRGGVGKTMAQEVYARLRQDILDATLEPDRKLHIRGLCTQYGVGLSPIREALSRLASERLVVQSAQRGFTVTSLNLTDLDELTRARKWLNEIGVRQSIAKGDAAWEEGVVLAYHRLSRTPRNAPDSPQIRSPAWSTAHRIFHASLLAACGSHWLLEFCETLFEAAERYRAMSRQAGSARSAHLDEHRAIMEATVARDAEAAVALLNAHFDLTATLVRATVEQGTVAPTARPRRRERAASVS